ncbi:MAG: two-component regulator propeller domain-containing protein [bacterium]
MRKVTEIFTFLLLYNLFLVGQANQNVSNQSDFTYQHLTIEDGLSQSTITCIFQDRKGYIWFGTANGLNKFDGYKFKVYYNDANDTTTISDNGISALFEDSEGILWIGTGKGILNKFDRKNEVFIRYSLTQNINVPQRVENTLYSFPIPISRYNENSITSITEDSFGNLWFATWGKGLVRMNKKSGIISTYSYDPVISSSISSNRILRILIDKKNNIWIGTFGGGLNKISVKSGQKLFKDSDAYSEEIEIQHYKNIPGNNNSLSDDVITSLMLDKSGNLWIGTYSGGLNLLSQSEIAQNKVTVNFKRIHSTIKQDGFTKNAIFALLESIDGQIWIGTFGEGIFSLNPADYSFTNYKNNPLNENSILDNEVMSLLQSKGNLLWVGTHLGKGISIMKPSSIKFGQIKSQPGSTKSISDDIIWAIYQDMDDILWLGTYRGGLNKIDRRTGNSDFYKYLEGSTSSISGNHIRSISEDKYGYLWVGTYSNGLNRFDKESKKFVQYKYDSTDISSIGGNQVQSIYFDKSGTMWVGVFGGGLNKAIISPSFFGETKFVRFVNNPNDPNSISDNRVYTIYEDKQGYLWVGTFGGGLNRFDKKTNSFKRFLHDPNNPSSLEDNRIMAIYQDSFGNLWIGTYGGGLHKLLSEKEGFKKYRSKDGLNSNVVYGILEDSQKCIWVSTDNGLYKLDILNESISHFEIQDGLQSMEFSGGAYFKNKYGEMFFGGINGVNYFYPEKVQINKNIPHIVINSVYVLSKEIKGEISELTLPYNQNFISFEFAALDYTSPVENEYAYKLEGLDKDWNYVDSKIRLANYTDLQPGEYIFRVIGSNNDGIWNLQGTSIRIIISPPFWQTWWFISLSVLFAGGLIYYVTSLRYKSLLSLEKLKSKLAADLHDSIGSGLTEISILSELASADVESKPDNASGKMNLVSQTARELVDVLSDIVWVVNPKRDSLYDLILRLKDRYNDFLSDMGVSLKIINLEKIKDIKLPMEYKQNLYMILKEGLTNCIRHSACKKILLEIYVNGSTFKISLTDDGKGLDLSKIGMGNGIRNMKSRAASIKSQINIVPMPDLGTRIEFTGKIKSNFSILHFLKITGENYE